MNRGPMLLEDEAATLAVGAELATLGLTTELVFLHGDLGAGKTTLVRGFLRALGHEGAVKSPTYTLLETYDLPAADRCATGRIRTANSPTDREAISIYHFDFYRIVDPRELGYMGIDELVSAPAIKLVEWPANAGDRLPKPDMDVRLEYAGAHRRVQIEDHRR